MELEERVVQVERMLEELVVQVELLSEAWAEGYILSGRTLLRACSGD